MTLDDRRHDFDVVVGPVGETELPDPAQGRSLRALLEEKGEELPPFSFEADRLDTELAAWAEALRRHAAELLG